MDQSKMPWWKKIWMQASPRQVGMALWAVVRQGGAGGAWDHALHAPTDELAHALLASGVSAQEVPVEALFFAIEQNSPKFEAALTAGASATQPKGGKPYHPLLRKAASMGNVVHVAALLAHGADVNARDLYGKTPLRHLFESFPSRSFSQGTGAPPLTWWEGGRQVAFALLRAGAHVEEGIRSNSDLRDPSMLHMAPLDLGILEVLIDNRGCDPARVVESEEQTNEEPNLLFRAVGELSLEEWPLWLVAMKRWGQGPETQASNGDMLAWKVIGTGGREHAAQLKCLMEHGFQVTGANAQGETLLHVWMRTGSTYFDHTGDALLAIPDVAAQAGWRNHKGQTAADVLVQDRAEWLEGSPECGAYVARLRAIELQGVLKETVPVVQNEGGVRLATPRRRRL